MRELPTGTVTLLFTDIEGSTRLLHLLGERYSDVLAECRELMRAAFHLHGHEVDTQGDAFFVAFARATDAVMAAVAVQRALASHSWPEGVTVRVRVGMHTGEPERSSEGYVGLDVHRAARIMSAGHGGQVLLSQVTRDLVEQSLPADVSLQDLGEHRLKDLGYPSHLYQLVIAGLEASFPPLKTLDRNAHNLPIQPTPFIGRAKVVTNIQQHLLAQEVRLLTLTGPGGVGKTRLGLQVAAEASDKFKDGTWFVSLAPISDPELVIPTIAETLNVREVAGKSQLEHLKAFLREKQLLLLLDNFEHVVSAATQVADLLGASPRLKMLVTSREALRVRAEREFPASALTLPDRKLLSDEESLALFRDLGNKRGIAQCLQQSALWLLTARGDLATIHARLEEMLKLHIELGNKDGMANYFYISSRVALSRGDAATAQVQMEQCLALWQEMGDRWYIFWSLAALGRIKTYQGDVAAALTFHEQSLEVAREIHEDWLLAYCLEGWASVVATQGKCAWAARLWGAAESSRERCGIPLSPLERVDYEPAVAAARTHLGEQAFAAAWEEGRAMTFEQALADPE